MNETTTMPPPDYPRIETAIRYLADHVDEQPSLSAVASEVGLSPFHLQRVFKRWAGISPKRLLQLLTVEHAKELLDESSNVLDAAYETGLTGPARLHDHFVALEAVTPGEYKRGGVGLEILYGVHDSPFGEMFLAQTARGICRLTFPAKGEAAERDWLAQRWPGAEIRRDPRTTAATARRVFDLAPKDEPLRLLVQGTNFQTAVWRALLEIPEGAVSTYSRIAEAIGRPRAVRAVGNAVGANPISYLIPCHRVLREVGALGGYRWGPERKQAILAWESARLEAAG